MTTEQNYTNLINELGTTVDIVRTVSEFNDYHEPVEASVVNVITTKAIISLSNKSRSFTDSGVMSYQDSVALFTEDVINTIAEGDRFIYFGTTYSIKAITIKHGGIVSCAIVRVDE